MVTLSLQRNSFFTPSLASEYDIFVFLFGAEDQGSCWRGRPAGWTTCGVQAAVRCYTTHIADNGSGMMEVWFCLMQCHWVGFVEPMGGVRWLWNLWGNFSGTWCHMLVVLSLAVLGFRYYVLCLCFEWSLLPVWYLIAHTSGIACCTFMKRVAEKFCSREKASIFAWLLNCILRIILQFGGCVLMLLYIFGVECCCPCFKNQNCYLAARLAERYIL